MIQLEQGNPATPYIETRTEETGPDGVRYVGKRRVYNTGDGLEGVHYPKEGYLTQPFTGALRVDNLCKGSIDITSADWTKP